MKFIVLFAALAAQLRPAEPAPQQMTPPSSRSPSPSDLLMAASLLDTPPGVPEPTPEGSRYWEVVFAIHQVAVERQLMDERETKYVMMWTTAFSEELNMLRRRRVEFDGVPPVGDSYRFPSRDYLNDGIRFNRAFRKHVVERMNFEVQRQPLFRRVLQETDDLYAVWDAARDATCEFYYGPVRRRGLKKLRELIGEAAYAAGELPPAAPTWRFNELK